MVQTNKLSNRFGTQDQNFFPENLKEKFQYVKNLGFDYFEIDGTLLVENVDEIKKAMKNTGMKILTACNGYEGWIGDFDEKKREKAVADITDILYALSEIGGKGLVIPAAWGMFTHRLPPMEAPRSEKEDFEALSKSLKALDRVAHESSTYIYLEPLNRYQDHMINTVADARNYIEANELKRVKIIADFYHMNIDENDISETLHQNKSLIHHLHVADNHRYQPGTGNINFIPSFRQLINDSYSGIIVYEGRIRARNEEHAYRNSVHYLKSLMQAEELRAELRKDN